LKHKYEVQGLVRIEKRKRSFESCFFFHSIFHPYKTENWDLTDFLSYKIFSKGQKQTFFPNGDFTVNLEKFFFRPFKEYEQNW